MYVYTSREFYLVSPTDACSIVKHTTYLSPIFLYAFNYHIISKGNAHVFCFWWVYHHSGINNYNQTAFLSVIDVLVLLGIAVISSLDDSCFRLACLFFKFFFFCSLFCFKQEKSTVDFCFSDSNMQTKEKQNIYNQIYKHIWKLLFSKQAYIKFRKLVTKNMYFTFH